MSRLSVLLFFLILLSTVSVFAQEDGFAYGADNLPFDLVASPETVTAVNAAAYAGAEMAGLVYSWSSSERADCSGYVARYLLNLGLPTQLEETPPTAYIPLPLGPIPANSTHMQVARFALLDEQLGGDLNFYIPVEQLLQNTDWSTNLGILPGSLIFWSKAEAQVDYNGWAHVTIVLGYTANGEPLFADFAPGMANGPVLGRTLKEIGDSLYWSDAVGGQDYTPFPTTGNPAPLQAYVVNTLTLIDAANEAGILENGLFVQGDNR